METRNRKPLSDLTNTFNLIPTSTLRKLVAASSKPPSLSILKSNSSSTNQKLCSEASNTSIGSSNVAWTVQFRTPSRSDSSIGSLGGMGSKDAAYNQRQIVEKAKKGTEASVVIVSPTPAEKRKDKGKAIAVPFNSSPPEKMKYNQNNTCIPGSSIGKKKQNSEGNLRLFRGSVDILKEFDKVDLKTYSRSHEKTEKRKATLSSSRSMGKQKEVEVGIPNLSSWSLEKSNDRKKGTLKHPGSSTVKTKDGEKEFVEPSSFSLERTKEKGMAILQPSNNVETPYCQPSTRKSERRKNDAGASSCPPMTIQNNLDGAGDFKSSKSWTDPHPKCRKKRCLRTENASELPLDFLEHQRAYFKEIDEFELAEEEISQDELD